VSHGSRINKESTSGDDKSDSHVQDEASDAKSADDNSSQDLAPNLDSMASDEKPVKKPAALPSQLPNQHPKKLKSQLFLSHLLSDLQRKLQSLIPLMNLAIKKSQKMPVRNLLRIEHNLMPKATIVTMILLTLIKGKCMM
jgi:hypothetical protein